MALTPVTPTAHTAAAEVEIDPWQLRDPALFLTQLRDLVPLRAGTFVALVRRPSTRQELLAALPITWAADDSRPGNLIDQEIDQSDRSELIRRAAVALWGRRRTVRHTPEHAFVTVVARTGRLVFGAEEAKIGAAWRYANHLLPVFDWELLLVTPSGWRARGDDSCGALPALRAASG